MSMREKNGMTDWNYPIDDWCLERDPKFRYQLLDRMRQDCEYYIRNNFETPNCLWAETEREQIDFMKQLWSSFPDADKPEWLTWEQILEFEKRMCK